MNVGILTFGYLLFSVVSFAASASEKRFLIRLSVFIGTCLLIFHVGSIFWRGLEAGRWPFTNTYETLVLFAFITLLIYLATFRRHRFVIVGGFVGLIAAVLLALTSLLSSEIEPLIPALKSNWLLFHVTSAFIGYSAFALGTACAIPALTPGRGNQDIRERWMEWADRMIAFGFPFLTLGIATGAVWADQSWGRYWNWDAKETWAFVTWIVYAVYLHLERSGESSFLQRAAVALLGFATVMFTYFGVNFWLSSLHAAYA